MPAGPCEMGVDPRVRILLREDTATHKLGHIPRTLPLGWGARRKRSAEKSTQSASASAARPGKLATAGRVSP